MKVLVNYYVRSIFTIDNLYEISHFKLHRTNKKCEAVVLARCHNFFMHYACLYNENINVIMTAVSGRILPPYLLIKI